MKKFIKEKREGYVMVDESTGEVSGVYDTRVVRDEGYCTISMVAIDELIGLSAGELRVLLGIVRIASFNMVDSDLGNIFISSAVTRGELRRLGVDMTDSGIRSCIDRLSKRGIILRRSRGMYILNPKIVFKGNRVDIAAVTNKYINDGKECKKQGGVEGFE